MSINGSRLARNRGFTLAEVLAALLFMAIIVPVAMHGVTVASRVGTLGQRKSNAMRIAERILDEQLVNGGAANGGASGTYIEGDVSYPWTMRLDPWIEDGSLSVASVHVTFDLQGNTYEVVINTLYDPNANTPPSTTSPTAASP
jgi:type II secretory pathway pseudopilin PulG